MARINAIPTRYAGVEFRSRLEAKWAAFFDLLEWKWEYEPIDLDGYIPDFVINKRLIEVKPALKFTDYRDAQEKIDESGWTGKASVVGAIIGEIGDGSLCFGVERLDETTGNPYWVPWSPEVDMATVTTLWREAGNRVQWIPQRKTSHARNRHVPVTYESEPAQKSADFVPVEEVKCFFASLALEDD